MCLAQRIFLVFASWTATLVAGEQVTLMYLEKNPNVAVYRSEQNVCAVNFSKQKVWVMPRPQNEREALSILRRMRQNYQLQELLRQLNSKASL